MPDKPTPDELLEWLLEAEEMDEPTFANIWGVSDEDLFRNALRVFDEQQARGERIFWAGGCTS